MQAFVRLRVQACFLNGCRKVGGNSGQQTGILACEGVCSPVDHVQLTDIAMGATEGHTQDIFCPKDAYKGTVGRDNARIVLRVVADEGPIRGKDTGLKTLSVRVDAESGDVLGRSSKGRGRLCDEHPLSFVVQQQRPFFCGQQFDYLGHCLT